MCVFDAPGLEMAQSTHLSLPWRPLGGHDIRCWSGSCVTRIKLSVPKGWQSAWWLTLEGTYSYYSYSKQGCIISWSTIANYFVSGLPPSDGGHHYHVCLVPLIKFHLLLVTKSSIFMDEISEWESKFSLAFWQKCLYSMGSNSLPVNSNFHY